MDYILFTREDEDGRTWRRASGPAGQSVDVSIGDDSVLVRDSKIDGGPVLVFSLAEWARHVAAVKDGVHDLVREVPDFPGLALSGPGLAAVEG